MQLSPTAAPQKEVLAPLGEVSATAEKVYAYLGDYALDEACVWPKQTRIAKDLGVCRDTVRVALAELQAAGWITWRRVWTWRDESGRIVLNPDDTEGLSRSRWQHNVYDLLGPILVNQDVARRRVQEAHRKADLRRLAKQSGTNYSVGEKTPPGGWCRCSSCRPDRTRTTCRPPVFSLKGAAILAAIRHGEEVYGRELTPDEKRVKVRMVQLEFEIRQMDFDREFPPGRPPS